MGVVPHLGALIDHCVDDFGDFDRLVCDGRVWRSREMQALGQRLAQGLIELGLAPGDRVVTLLPNCAEVLVVYAAIWRAGLVLVPLHPTTAPGEIVNRLRSSGATVVVVAEHLAEAVAQARREAGLALTVIAVPTGRPASVALAAHGFERLAHYAQLVTATPFTGLRAPVDDRAAIMFTGGTTGRPKGVVLTHANLWAAIHSVPNQDRRYTGIWVLPMSHIGGILYPQMQQRFGFRTLLVTDPSPRPILEHIRDYRADCMHAVPTIFMAMLAYPEADQYDVSSVTSWIYGGASFPEEKTRAFERRFGGTMHAIYGLTETCAQTTTSELQPARKPGSVGRPARPSDFEVAIFDEHGAPVPVGELGEVCMRGASVTPGYLDLPEETARLFRDGWLRTGDIGRLDADGDVFLAGRSKDLIIRGGANVYPEEVESVIAGHPHVPVAAVVGLPDELYGEEVVAFVTCTPAAGAQVVDELVARCRDNLAAYKVPRFEVLDSLPRTPVGKLDKQALRGLGEQLQRERRARAAAAFRDGLGARGPRERRAFVVEQARTLARRVLGLGAAQPIAETEPLQHLGLDSISATELGHQLGEQTGMRVAATLLYNYPTLAGLAEHVLAQVDGGRHVEPAAPAVAAVDDPIAIVAMACRFPGGIESPEDLWQLFAEGRDAVRPIPASRWNVDDLYDPDPAATGKLYAREGAMFDDIDRFDPALFGIAPREATSMDPQQRLLLETSWQLFERANLVPDRLRETPTGVYVGLYDSGYREAANPGLDGLDGYVGTGNLASVASGRISYVFGLQGPAMTIDTACSSSLVALHLASAALRAGECELAVAGGVSLMVTPSTFVEFSRLGGLSATGRCRSFSADADGTGWGEGCALLLLKRLSDAQRDGDRVWAVIRSSAVNQDGRSQGLTAPNGPAQSRVIRRALAVAGLSPDDIDYVDAHGTGTRLGDPIEAEALREVFRGRTRPLLLGSAKSNLAHTQAAAGAASVLKVVLAMAHEQLPATLHAAKPTPHVPWTDHVLELASAARPWPHGATPRRAGVSSFGISGTNAHVVIEEPPASPPATLAGSAWTDAVPVVISAQTVAAVAAQAAGLATVTADHVDVARTLATSRMHFEQRVAFTAASRAELATKLASLAAGDQVPGSSTTPAGWPGAGKLAWLFTGQGSQRARMGHELYAAHPVYRAAIDRCLAAFEPYTGPSLRASLFAAAGTPDAARLDRTGTTQPALFAVEWALAQLWASFGVEPDFVMGHSIGELVAATVAGVWSLADACKLVAARGRLMDALPAGGAMAAIDLPVDAVRALLDGAVALAAVNGPAQVVVSGTEAAVAALVERAAAQGARAKRLVVSHAFHSPLMEPMLGELRAVAQSITYAAPAIPLVSNLAGDLGGDVTEPEYWVRHVREAVRFREGIGALEARGVTTFVELGPQAVLTAMAQACVAERARRAFVPSLRASGGDVKSVFEALGAVHVHGHAVDWARAFAPIGGGTCTLPTYPFQRQRYWLGAGRASAAASLGATTHPLIGGVYRTASTGTTVVVATLSRKSPAWARDHRVFDRVLVSGTTILELCRAAVETLPEPRALEALAISAPIELPETGAIRVQVEIVDAQVTVYGRPAHDESAPWTPHATAQAVPPVAVDSPGLGPAWPAGDELVGDAFYAGLARRGLDYGPAFRGLRHARALDDGSVLAQIALPPELHADAGDHGLHPALLDAALHALMTFAGEADETRVALPVAFGRVVIWKRGLAAATVRMDRVATDDGVRVDLTLWDGDGVPAARVTDVVARRADATSLRRAAERKPRELFEIAWHTVEAASPDATGAWLVIAEPEDALAAAIAGELVRRGGRVEVAAPAHAQPPSARIVRLWPVVDTADVPATTLAATATALGELQQLATATSASADVVWITREAIAARLGEPVRGLVHAALWGLQRSARAEHPALGLRLVDAPRTGGELARLVDAIVQRDEAEVAVREGELRVPRLVANAPASERLEVPAAPGYRLESAAPGRLDRLELVASPRRALAAGEVRVDVRASGLNFRDVLNALGMYPGEAGPLGSELAGVVTELGADVDGLAVGDRVMGFGAGTFGSEAVCDARVLVAIPAALGFAAAATVPLVFATAYYALHDLARVRPGERLLVHAATGGVGMAALQLARLWGLEVFATASPAKWPVLHALGHAPDHVASSRDVSFEAAFRAASPAGVDIVLDSLAGELVDASLRLLAPGGRFLEMGKTDIRDIRDAARLPAGASYAAFDLSDPGPARLREILLELVALLERGAITPLPHRAFGLAHAPAVFRAMAQARHVGKLVLEPPRRETVPARGTILVTGGAGALGLAAARWLASRGVAHLVLASRRGAEAEAVRELEALGARVTVAACDVAVLADVRAVIAAIPADLPLRGVVHCAGVLDDGVLVEQTAERLRTVMAPKVMGAWNLHEATRGLPLELFVVYSSVAAIGGSPGQSNYAAANAFLDALAHDRRAAGLPALSLAWGAWAGGGLATRAADLVRLAKQGFDAIAPARGLELLEAALERDVVHQVPWALELARVAKAFANGKVPGLWRALVRPARASSVASSRLADLLAPLPPAERRDRVVAIVRDEAAQVLGMSAGADIPLKQSLGELGVDSLMAVELRNRLTERFDARLPSTLLFDYPSVEGVAGYLLDQILGTPMPVEAAAPRAAPEPTGYEPIAIVAMACRLPGGSNSPELFWELLEAERDAIVPVPDKRWNTADVYDADRSAKGKSYAREGGFLDDIAGFDAAFFGIAPREAISMDPQQRLLLETAWQTIENAGIVPDELKNTVTGVYVGMYFGGYSTEIAPTMDELDGYVVTGNSYSVASGRLSYVLGLQGPSMTVDTACSSSLVSVHLACQALRSRECDLALAGGVTAMASPYMFVEFSRLGAMSPSGRCRSFSAEADGAGWGEGCGMFLLKRLADAQRDGDEVLAIVRSSAINQDGRSQGLTAPNGPAQVKVIRRALEIAGLGPADIDHVEAHGTGTKLGDPLEVGALGEVFSRGQTRANPLYLGSVKSNIAHTQAAAGAAGIMKVVLALQHEQLPRSLHSDAPTTHVEWADSGLTLLNRKVAWPRGARVRRAGVSSYGISGTNAHVIIEEAPPPVGAAVAVPAAEPDAGLPATQPFVITGRTDQAVRDQAGELARHVRKHPAQRLVDLAYSLVVTRTQFARRAVIWADTREELIDRLEALARGASPTGCAVSPKASAAVEQLAMVFTGQGSQRAGMGQELYGSHAVFRRALDECAAAFDPLLARPLLEVMFAAAGSEAAALLDRTAFTQPALFAFEYAMAALWKSVGVEPRWVLGHSIGEIAAAAVAGVWSLEDACLLVAERGRLMDALPAGGAMLSVEASEADVAPLLRGREGQLSIAAVNGPRQVVISGDADAVDKVAQKLVAKGARTKALRVSHAFHSPRMEPMLAAFEDVACTLTYWAPELALVSNLTGELATDEVAEADYWVRHVRGAVRFADGARTLEREGAAIFLEVGPHPVLTAMAQECLAEPATATFIASARAQRTGWQGLFEALGALYVRGQAIDWAALLAPWHGRKVALPTYAFQRTRYWREPPAVVARTAPTPAAFAHPLVTGRAAVPPSSVVFTATVGAQGSAYLHDHRICGTAIFPATGYVELALAAARSLYGAHASTLEDLTFERTLALGATAPQLSIVVGKAQQGAAPFEIYSATADDAWTLHARGRIPVQPARVAPSARVPAELLAGGTERAVADVYGELAKLGLEYGPRFRNLTRLVRRGDGAAVGRVELPAELHADASGYLAHPALVDAALHALAAADAGGGAPIPVAIRRLTVHAPGATAGWVHATTATGRGDAVVADVTLLDDRGAALVELEGFEARRIDQGALRAAIGGAAPAEHRIYRIDWEPRALASRGAIAGRWAIVADRAGLAALVGEAIARRGGEVVTLDSGPLAGVVYLAGLDATADTAVDHDALEQTWQLAELGKTLAGTPRLVVVTRNAVACADGERPYPSQSALWGLARTVALELPPLAARLVDLEDGGELVRDAARIADLLAHDDGEPEVAYRGEQRLASRLARHGTDAELRLPGGASFELYSAAPGILDKLALRRLERPAPDTGEVEVEVHAVGLNFRDVMGAMGVYPGGPEPLGQECAGVVTRVGVGVTRYAIGDRVVVGLVNGALRRFAIAQARFVAPMPRALSFEQAVTLPITFLTAIYGFEHLAKLAPGERVLIHAAAGGVGQAAVQLALALGAEVFATAGSPRKRNVLRRMGVAHVFDSRSLAFADAIRAATGGAGVDVVLNSLAGDFIPASLGLLRAGGRFIEIGKMKILTPAEVPAGIAYFHFDTGVACLEQPGLFDRLFARLVDGLDRGELRPLPMRCYPITRAVHAFRAMAQGRHVGKLVIRLVDEPLFRVRADASYLVTGGTGGLGQAIGNWLLAAGAGRVVLASRRGTGVTLTGALATSDRVSVLTGDVADPDVVRGWLVQLDANARPLAAVFHAGGVIDDAPLHELGRDRFAHAFHAKVGGAWTLHRELGERPLDAFVLFGSIAGQFGNPGQANYAAANACLDGLAAMRRADGQAALVVDWGPWSEVGMAADPRIARALAAMGFAPIAPASGTAVLQALLADAFAHAVVMDVDWPRFLARPAGASPRYERLRAETPVAVPTATPTPALAGPLASARAAHGAAREAAIAAFLEGELRAILGLGATAELDPTLPIESLGVDSLMAAELRNRLQDATAAPFTLAELLAHPTIAALGTLVDRLLGTAATPVFAASPAPAIAMAGPLARAAGATGAARREAIAGFLEGELRAILGLAGTAELDRSVPLESHGVDSLMAAELRNRLGDAIAGPLAIGELLAHPTIDELVGLVSAKLPPS